ncbi:MAG: DUF4197 domain-containing protein [Bacteroidota bacterium]|nr:DUF4197 domain-containing protein [Bacteroidota bacterium]
MKSSLYIAVTIFCLFLLGCTTQQVSQTIGDVLNPGLTSQDVAQGLKEALTKGISEGADAASKVDGYLGNSNIKIPLPPEIQKVESRLRQIGMGKEVDQFITTLNRGAEKAAAEAKPIFVSAIRSMTIQDAWGILKGDNNAATAYLERTTSAQLEEKFSPIIQKALDQVNATRYYTDLVTTYNRIPGVQKINEDLNAYATDKAMAGLFFLVAQEEANIRKNPAARSTELLKKVFEQQ